MRTGILLFLIGLMFAAPASAAIVTTIDIDQSIELANNDQLLTTQGYQFSSSGGFIITDPPVSPSNAVHFCGACGIELAEADGRLFDLISFEHGAVGGQEPYTLNVTGYYAGGQTISASFDTIEALTLDALGAGWTGLERVVFQHSTDPTPFAGYLDNIQVSTVPIPAAAWLFASGLGLLGWARRRA